MNIETLASRVALTVALCEEEMLSGGGRHAPIPVSVIAYALQPDVYAKPSDWDVYMQYVDEEKAAEIREELLDGAIRGDDY